MEEDLELNINPNVMCRVCLAENQPKMKSIFTKEIVNGSIVLFPDVYRNATNLVADKNDGLPENICDVCRKRISEFYAFKEKCKNSDELLRKILQIPAPKKILEKQPTEGASIQRNFKEEQKEFNDVITQTYIHENAVNSMTQTDFNVFEKNHVGTQTNRMLLFQADEQNPEIDNPKQEIPEEQMSIIDEEHLETFENEFDIDYADSENVNDELSEKQSANEISVKFESHSTQGQEQEEYERDDYDVGAELEAEYLIETEDELNDNNLDVEFNKKQYEFEIAEDNLVANIQHMEEDVSIVQINDLSESDAMGNSRIKYGCDICHITFNSDEIGKHKNFHRTLHRQILQLTSYYRCGQCMSIFVDVEQFEEHLLNVDCTDIHATISDKNYIDYQFLNDQIDQLATIPSKIYSIQKIDQSFLVCDYCYEEMDNDMQFILNHFNKHHFNIDDDKMINVTENYEQLFATAHRCGNCGKIFSNLMQSIQHVFSHLDKFQCIAEQCTTEHKELNHLYRHVNFVHENLLRQLHKCGQCSKEFKSFAWYQTHIISSCTGNLSLTCKICGKTYAKYQALKSHLRVHLSERRFVCDVCDKRFMQKGDLIIHMRIHTGDRPYECKKCSKKFRTMANLNDHMSTHEEEKKFQCNICQQSFISIRTLRGHTKLHQSEKPFECKVCKKKFHRRTHITSHMKTHTKNLFNPEHV